MNEPIDRGRGRHRVLEDPVPLAEDEVVALGEEREEDLGLVGGRLDVAEIVEDDHVVRVEGAQRAGQREIAARGQQHLDELVRGREHHADAGVDERVAERAGDMALADAGLAEQQHVLRALDEAAARQLLGLEQDRPRDAVLVEGLEGLGRRQSRGPAQALDPTVPPRLCLGLEDLGEDQQALIAAGIEEPLGHLLRGARQLELDEQLGDAVAQLGRVRAHAASAAPVISWS